MLSEDEFNSRYRHQRLMVFMMVCEQMKGTAPLEELTETAFKTAEYIIKKNNERQIPDSPYGSHWG